LDRLGIEGVKQLLGAGRKDESGDFTKGAGLNPDATEKVISFVHQAQHMEPTKFPPTPGAGLYGRSNIADYESNLDNWERLLAESQSGLAGVSELREIAKLLDASGYRDRVEITAEVVRGLEYYTGTVFEVELTLETKDEKGRPVRFGSVGGGGRYDGLVSRFRGEPVPATGFSIGVSRLQAALTMLGKLDTTPEFGPVVVTVFDRDRVADYQKMVAALRNANIRAELYLGNPKNMGNQLKYADRRNSPCVIIQGSDEKDDPAGPQVLLKDLILGAELAKSEKDREEYLQKQGEAQTKVPQTSLVDEVRKILDRHGVKWN
jgi:histidyl-tRNA synthetase